MKKSKIKKLAKELRSTDSCAFMSKGMLYVINYSPDNDGFMVDRHDPYDLSDDPEDGGLCTGSAKDAIEFML